MKKDLRKTNIIGTIGPASESEEMFTKLVNAGLNVARINFSHGGFEENKEKVETIKRVREKLNKPVALMLDTKGPEIRTGVLESGNEKVKVEEGQEFTLVNDDIIGNNTKTSVSYKELYKDVKPGAKILIDDGALELRIEEIVGKDIKCKALNTAMLGSRKTINVPELKLNLPALSQKDIDDITNGIKAGFDVIAASFVRRPSDVLEIRNLLDNNGGEHIKIISKIESQEGVDNFEEILKVTDGIMVARGDLGVEIPMEQVPIVQKRFIRRCNEVGKPVIIATQMLESMISNPRPTRAEVSDVSNAIFDMSTAIMLSGETANGKYPVECVKLMNQIASNTEQYINYWKRFRQREADGLNEEYRFNIYNGVCVSAMKLNAKAILTYTESGSTPRIVSSFSPKCPIYAITENKQLWRQLNLQWNVYPMFVDENENVDKMITQAFSTLKAENKIETDDIIIIAGGAEILPEINSSINKVIGGIIKV